MISRKTEKDINDWIANGKRALLVSGARQTGKTFLIRECLKNSKKPYVEINLIEQPGVISVLESITNTEDLILRLSAVAGKELIPKETIFFLDEIQEYEEIVTRIKFLVDEGSFRYILSGSLLGIELNNIRSAPVGYMDIIDMFPLDLEEFYRALGMQQVLYDNLKRAFEDFSPVDPYVHERLLKTFYLYLIIGGMPQAVQTYLDTNDLAQITQVQDDIIRLYKHDFTKYEKGDGLRLKEVYDAIPSELKEQNKRFYLNRLGKKTEYAVLESSFIWLKDAGVALPVYNAVEPKAPLQLNEKRNLFKLFYADVGLLTSRYSSDIKLRILANDVNVNHGALFENAIAQELVAHGYQPYYYNHKKRGEVDFLIETEDAVLPIEVKSGKDYKRHNALDNLLEDEIFALPKGIVLCNGNVQTKGKRVYLPVYMAMFIKQKKMPHTVYKIDLSTLTPENQ